MNPFDEISVEEALSLTEAGKAVTKVTYVQSMARMASIRITAESNGITATVDAILPIVKDDK